jgi:hypothetical protein
MIHAVLIIAIYGICLFAGIHVGLMIDMVIKRQKHKANWYDDVHTMD